MIDVSVVIVDFNAGELLTSCITSLFEQECEYSMEVILVDNGSQRVSSRYLGEFSSQVQLIRNEKNLGFATANNMALRHAQGRYTLVLNPDTKLPKSCLEILLSYMDTHPTIGILSPQLVRADGTMDYACRRAFPNVLDLFFRLSGIDRLFPKSRVIARYNMTYADSSISCEVDSVAGAFMLIRQAVFTDIGHFDEQFFLYGEDIDFCFRAKKSGWSVFYFAELIVLHLKGMSSRQYPIESRKEFYRALGIYYSKHRVSDSPLMNMAVRITLWTALQVNLTFIRAKRVWNKIKIALDQNANRLQG